MGLERQHFLSTHTDVLSMVEILVHFNEWQGLGLLQVKSYVIFTLNAALKLFLSFLLNVPAAPLPCKRKTEQVWHLYVEGVRVLTVGKVFLFFWKTMILITFLFQAEAPLPRCHKRSPIDNQVPSKLFFLSWKMWCVFRNFLKSPDYSFDNQSVNTLVFLWSLFVSGKFIWTFSWFDSSILSLPLLIEKLSLQAAILFIE